MHNKIKEIYKGLFFVCIFSSLATIKHFLTVYWNIVGCWF